jgi:hypothetical protein
LAKIKHLASFKNFSSLQYLVDWMVTHSYHRQNKDRHGIAHDDERLTRIRVELFEYGSEGTAAVNSLTNIHELQIALHSNNTRTSNHDSAETPSLRLFLIEDISYDVVELLGSRFNIDPLFFEAYVDHDNLATPPLSKGQRLRMSAMYRQWFRLQSVRLHFQLDHNDIINDRKQSECFNINRRCYPRHPYGSFKLGITDTRTTIWIGNDLACANITIGIVLVDPTIAGGKWLSRDRDACVHMPNLNKLEAYSLPKRPDSWYGEIVEMTSRYPWFASPRSTGVFDQLAIVCPSIYATCAEWLETCEMVDDITDKIGWEMRRTPNSGSMATHIDTCLRRLSEWRWNIRTWRKMAKETLNEALPAAARLTAGTVTHLDPPPSALDDITFDFERVLSKLEELETRVERLIDRATSEMQIAAARESLAESHNLARLTWLATIFIPLTFMSGLFSMSDNIGSMKDTFKIYFTVAIPVAIIALVIARWGSTIFRFGRNRLF